MIEALHIHPPKNTLKSQVLRHTLNVTLMGILNSCTVQKSVSTDNLIPYPSAGDMLSQPFAPETTSDVQNLSNFFLQSAQKPTEYVDDNGIVISEGD